MSIEGTKLRLLITGATGFIGGALAVYFTQQGYFVRATARNRNHPFVIQHPEIEWVFCDLAMLREDDNLCKNIDVVLHAAGYAHAAKKNEAVFFETHQRANKIITCSLATIAKNKGVKRFIFFSSVKTTTGSSTTIDESHEAIPIDAYGLSKREAEELLLKMDDLDVIILRLSLVYGHGWKGNLATMLKAIDRGIFPPVPKINNKKSMVGIPDVCRATQCAINASLQKQRVFIITDGKPYSTHQIQNTMTAALGKKMPKWVIPLWLWKCFAILGDLIETLSRKSFPINSESLEKLFGSAHYESLYAEKHLGFIPQDTFSDIIPEIIKAYKRDRT